MPEENKPPEIPPKVIERFCAMCIQFPPHILDALIMIAFHAKAFQCEMEGPQKITIEFDPADGPYYTEEPEEEDAPKLILPGKP